MDAEVIIRSAILGFLAAALAPWLVWRFRYRLGWAVRAIERVFDWVTE